jgi:hypothetical protein
MVRVRIPAGDWTALSEFVSSQHPLPHGIEKSVHTAERDGPARIVAFQSADSVRFLIECITAYARSWEVPWAVSLNRVLPRLYQAINAR